MGLLAKLKRFGFDLYFVLLLATVALASLVPAREMWADLVSRVAFFGVALLFFLYGARLNPRAILDGLTNWRLQSLVALQTYAAFPIAGLALAALVAPLGVPEIALGILFLSILPSTVQSSVAFTALAQGNVPGAVCAATLSNLAGVLLTPILAALLLGASVGGFSTQTVVNIAIQILLPFALGQILRPRIGRWVERRKRLTLAVDRGAILLIVYSAFSAGVVAGIWQALDGTVLAAVVVVNIVLLAAMLGLGIAGGRAARLPREDRLALLFCGSTKSLATGLPIAKILFPGEIVSLVILPLMLFHQIQLLTCAIIAQRQAQRLAPAPVAS